MGRKGIEKNKVASFCLSARSSRLRVVHSLMRLAVRLAQASAEEELISLQRGIEQKKSVPQASEEVQLALGMRCCRRQLRVLEEACIIIGKAVERR